MTKRGANLGGEFRYLEPSYNGQISADVHAHVTACATAPAGASSGQHRPARFDTRYGRAWGSMLNVNRVSDDNYWRDFGRVLTNLLRQRLLPGDAHALVGRNDMTASECAP